MEAYVTTCSDCGHIRRWTGYKTGLGKSPAQLKKMDEDMSTCKKCGSTNVKTGLDHESELAKALDAQGQVYADAIRKTFLT